MLYGVVSAVTQTFNDHANAGSYQVCDGMRSIPDGADLLNFCEPVLQRKPRVVVEFGGQLRSVETKAEFRHFTESYHPR